MRLDKQKQQELEPQRINFALKQLEKRGLEIISKDNTKITFKFKNNLITLYPYSGWFTGKGITDGRGINNLFKQINDEQKI